MPGKWLPEQLLLNEVIIQKQVPQQCCEQDVRRGYRIDANFF
jgi:hypothetical protein